MASWNSVSRNVGAWIGNRSFYLDGVGYIKRPRRNVPVTRVDVRFSEEESSCSIRSCIVVRENGTPRDFEG